MDRTAPECSLRLEWVYGYRGHQVRSNLYYNDQNEIVYFVAGIGIVHNYAEQKQRFFLGHDDDIISLAMHPDKVQVATGQVGKAPQIIVWSSKTLEATSICKGGHTDGIGILTFDKSGEKLASCGIDQDSTICVWDWKRGKMLAKSFGHQEKAFDLQFNVFKDNSLVSVGVKTVNFWSLMGNTLQKKKGLFGDTKNMQTMFCVGFGHGGGGKDKELYYTGSMDGRIYVWKENKVEEILPGVHNGAVYCMIQLDEGGFITAGKDGRIRSWDPNFTPLEIIDLKSLLNDNSPEHFCIEDIVIKSLHVNKAGNLLIGTQSSEIFQLNMANVAKIDCVCKGHAEGELWSLACSSSDPDMIATASDDQTVRIWNIRTKRLVKIAELEKKIRSCAFNKDSTHLACGLSDGTLVVLKTSDMSVVKKQKIRGEVLHEMKYSPCGMFLAVGSNENYVDVFSGSEYKKVGTCSGNSSFITHLDWSRDSQFIQTNSGDAARLVYKIPSCKQHTAPQAEIDKIVWETFTGVLGNEVVGIWEKYTNKTDVNATDCNFEQQCIATGDDFGLVKLFRYPSLKKGAKFRKYVGHSSHVTNVRFTHDKTRLMSIGGADHAIFQWRFIPAENQSLVKTKAANNLPVDASAKILPAKDANKQQKEDDEIPEQYQAYMDSNSEDSDSEMSGREVDSDIEREKEISYDRTVYKTDLIALKPRLKEELKKAEIEQGFTRQAGPEVSLALEFVYGYRGYDCRDNLFYIHESGDIVYHVAALGIVLNKDTQTQKFYDQHTDDILALCLHPVKGFVATGQIGRDPPIHVWDIETMKTLSVLKGEHARGICSLNFSSDGKKLASVGLDDNHCICVWDWRKGEKLATTRGNKEKIFCIKWNPHNSDKLVTVGVKHIKFWNQVGAGFTSNRGLFGKLSTVDNMMCITFGKTPEVCYTGGSNGSIYVWREAQLIKLIPAHEGPIFSIYAHEKWEAYVTGGKDGSIVLWNGEFTQIHKYVLNKASLSKKSRGTLLNDNPSIRAISLASKKILIGTKNGEIIDIDKDGVITIIVQGHGEGEVWGLACHPTRMECCTASDDKTVRLWSVQEKSMHMIRGRVFDKLARSCEYSPNGQFIVVGFKEGAVVILKSDTLELVETISHRSREISDLKFSPVTGKYLAVGSHEDLIDIYNVDTRKRVGICKGASSYITHVEWDVEGKLIAINSGAKEILYYEMPRGTRVNINADDVNKITWATFTSVLGPTCSGIWQPCMDVTDINTTCLSHDRRTLATGDDFGLVKLFNYPCPGKFAKFKRYMGHSSHVTMVRWTYDDSCLLSIGGNDTSLMIWRNMAFEAVGAVDVKSEAKLNASSVRSDLLVMRNARKGESEDSETDSEDEGYDSDVKREHVIDYNKNVFKNEIQRPSADVVQQMYKQVKDSERIEKSKPSRMVKTKFKRTKVTKMRGAEGKEIDPLTLLHVMAKISAVGAQNNQLEEGFEVKQDIGGLKLSHVHGYRGFDCRDNVFYVNEGAAIVFPAAAAGIVHDLATNTQSFYLEHTDDIISLIVNENPKFKNVVATGQIGANPVIRIWDALTKETLSILSGLHKSTQGVCSLDFSSSGKLLLSVGLDKNYTIGVWRWKEGTLVASASADRYPNRVFRAAFRPDSDTTFVSVGFKHIQFWSVAGSELVKKKGVLTDWDSTGRKLKKMPTMLSLGFGQDNVTYTGTMSGDIYVWKENVLARAVLHAHTGPIFSMYTSLFDGCILTGAKEIHTKDSAPIKLWDKDMKKVVKSYAFDTGKSVNVIKAVSRTKNKIIIGTKSNEIYEIQEKTSSLQCLITTHGEGELWGLAVHPSRQIFITGSYECFLKVWDVPTKKVLKTFDVKVKVRSLDIRFDGSKLVIGSAEGDVILYELSGATFDQIKKLDMNRQRKCVITDVKFSPKKNYLAAGSDECYIDFYEITEDNTLNRVSYCKQVPGPILQMDWSTSGEYVKVGTTNYCTVVYQAPKGNQVKEDTIHDSVEWNHWTSIFGAEVIGIWPSGSASNFINCAHLASASGRLAVGDDDGTIKLYKFPCPDKDAPFDVYYGHSSNITNVKFICTNTHLISIGADDFCVFVWECI